MPNINTLVEDIYSVIEGKGGWDKTITEYLATNIAQTAEARFKEPQKPRGYLSLSSVGSPCKRKTWYRINKTEEAAPLKPQLQKLQGMMFKVSRIVYLFTASKVTGMQSLMV